jgi:drug/metabolite transporter (DMT)-like permease
MPCSIFDITFASMVSSSRNIYLGTSLAILATIIWSGNFIVARGISEQIGPVSLAFYRWLTATLIIAPFAWKQYKAERAIVKSNWKYVFWTSLTGIAIFNTCVYVAGHYTTAINLALIGTTSSPVFSTIMAIVFLKEKTNLFRLIGFGLCISGIILLLSQGSWETLAAFRFSKGDLWVIAGALAFAIYSILVRRKPAGISPINFLFVIFAAGTGMLLPFYIAELFTTPAVSWNLSLAGIILYLGAGASVIAFLCWNRALQHLGASKTVLYGNLIPVFSVWEAVIFLGEKITTIHLISGGLVIAGLVIANSIKTNTKTSTNYEVRSTKK